MRLALTAFAMILLPLSAASAETPTPQACASLAQDFERGMAALEPMIKTLRQPALAELTSATNGEARAALLRATQAQRKALPSLIEFQDALGDVAREFRACANR